MDPLPLPIKTELLDALVKSLQRPEDLFGPEGLFQRLKAALMERLLDAEMTEHLGFELNGSPTATGNRRNGYTSKTVQTETGPVRVRVPRDRAGTFAPKLVAKHQRRLEGFDEKVLSLYAQGVSTRDIQRHLRELYGTEVSPDLISQVTDAVLDEARAWQARPLERLYPVVYLDALFVRVRDQGAVTKKAVYVALGVTLEGRREVLGLWMAGAEGARFWLGVLTDLKQRGVEDVLVVCCDGLSGFPQAVEAAFPRAVVQTCIVHLLRASLRYVTSGDRKEVVNDLKAIYGAATEGEAARAREALANRWLARYPAMVSLWRSRWAEVVPFLAFPTEIRRILYTTNAIESLNSQLRRPLRVRGHFPTDDAVFKVLYLAIERASFAWKPSKYWPQALAYFAILYPDRLPT